MKFATATSDISTIVDWLQTWQCSINERKYEDSRRLFDPSVIGYGTKARVALGLDELEQRQWRQTWPLIEDFRFDLDELTVLSQNQDSVVVLTTWSSLGILVDGSRFHREGRMTLVLRKDPDTASWKAVHTHFSLTPEK